MSLLAWVYGTGDANVSYEAATILQMIDCCCAEVHTCRRIGGIDTSYYTNTRVPERVIMTVLMTVAMTIFKPTQTLLGKG